ncbi:MAG: DUF6291 domain-containing protein [Oscillospiraceae bacterium]|jgi:hypothetical protein|nr:DUF6291 domain-containing protein [Oscillospiraceae bacterium]
MPNECFLAYHSYLEICSSLNEAEFGRLMRAALKYSAAKEAPNLPGNEKHLFGMLKMNIDRDGQKYAEKCETNKANILKRWKNQENIQSYTTVYERIPTDTNCTNKNKSKNNIKKESIAYAIPKKKFGEFKNVLLKEAEFEKLNVEYGKEAQEFIEYLSSHIEMKGYKAKSHYLAIKKWVVLALREQKLRESKLKDGGQTYAKVNETARLNRKICTEYSEGDDPPEGLYND